MERNNDWLSPEDLADEIHVPVGTVYQWRYKGTGPKGFKIGRHVRFRRADVDRWIEEQADPTRATAAS